MSSFRNDKGRNTELLPSPAIKGQLKNKQKALWIQQDRNMLLMLSRLGVLKSFKLHGVVDPSVSLGLHWFCAWIGHLLLFLGANSASGNLPSTKFCKFTIELWEGMMVGICNLDLGTSGAEIGGFLFVCFVLFTHHTFFSSHSENYHPKFSLVVQ